MEKRLAVMDASNEFGGEHWRDPRSQFQERVQAKYHMVPEYVVVSREGPAHAPTFTVEVRVKEKVWGVGTGASKRDAIRNASVAALKNSCDALE